MSWKTTNLGKLCKIFDSLRKPITKKFRKRGKYPYYGATGIVDYVDDYIFNETLVLIGEDGAKWNVGEQTAFIVSGKYWVNNHAHVIKPDEDKLNQKFLVYYLNSINLNPWVTGITVPKLNQEKLKSIPIPLPSIAEQKKIVDKLDMIFAGIDKTLIATNNNIKNTEKLFQSYLTEVFKHGSKDWKIYSIKELGKVITGSTPKTSVAENYGDFISFVKPGDFKTDGSIDFEKQKLSKIGMSKSRVVEKKSSLMVCIGATIGKSGYTDIDIVTNQQINSITPTSKFNYKFIYYQMLTSEFQKKVMNSYGQATLPIINKSKWQSLTMKLPSIDEQLEMVKTLDNLRIETDILKNKLLTKTNELSSLKLSILRQGLAGELAQVA
jgi:type I restriction enzyme S subunit